MSVPDATGAEDEGLQCPACQFSDFTRTILAECGCDGDLPILVCNNCGIILAEAILGGGEVMERAG